MNGNPIGEPFFNIEVNNNILSGINPMAVSLMTTEHGRDYRGARMIEGIRFENNLMYSSAGGGTVRAKLPHQQFNELHTPISSMEQLYPHQWQGNILNTPPQITTLANFRPSPGREYMPLRWSQVLFFNFAPQSGSPARDNARPGRHASGLIAGLTRDAFGVPRPSGAGPDIGAIEAQ